MLHLSPLRIFLPTILQYHLPITSWSYRKIKTILERSRLNGTCLGRNLCQKQKMFPYHLPKLSLTVFHHWILSYPCPLESSVPVLLSRLMKCPTSKLYYHLCHLPCVVSPGYPDRDNLFPEKLDAPEASPLLS